MRIGRAQRVNVTLTKVTGAHQVRATPSKDGPVLSLGQHICHESRMATVAVRKGVDENQAVMKADGEFIGRIGFVLQPIARIAKQGGEAFANFMVGNTNVFFGCSISARPLPSLIEHSQMEISYVWLDKRVTPAKIVGCECPRVRFENVLSFPLI